MEILLLILLLIAGLTVLTVFGIIAFQSIQDFLEERRKEQQNKDKKLN